jgi:hypothetical protein
MDDIRLMTASSSPSSTILKPVCSPLTGKTDSTSLIQQSDVSSSRPALLAHDALGPLLFEVCQGNLSIYLYIYIHMNKCYWFFFLLCVLKGWR